MFGVSNSLIRFWESEFEILKPMKNSKGERRFMQKDIDHFRMIYHLVKERGFTLDGAKKEIEAHQAHLQEKFKMIDRLNEIKSYFKKELEALN